MNLENNFFTMVREGSVRPYGYMGLLPKFGEIPLILVSGSKGLIIISPELEYHEPLILLNTSTAFGQPAFFFKDEEFGMSIIFTLVRMIENGNERHNCARMPFKQDFYDIMKEYKRLPPTSPYQGMEIIKELNEMKTKI